jgi:hypothetical protein
MMDRCRRVTDLIEREYYIAAPRELDRKLPLSLA